MASSVAVTVAEEIVAVTPGEDVPLSALIASLKVFLNCLFLRNKFFAC